MREKIRRVVLIEPGRFALEEVNRPSPNRGEALIRVSRIGICGSDISAFYGRHPYIHCPIVLGHEFAGIVEEIGPEVTGLSVGTRCTVIPHLVCGKCPACLEGKFNLCNELRVIGAQVDGAFTACVVVPATMVVPVPDTLSLEQAVLVEPGAVGYHAAWRGSPEPHETALVFGAGPIGIFTMQSLKALGAGKVLISDRDAERLALARRQGADGAIDISTETVEEGLERLVGGKGKVDLFFDCVGFGGDALDDIICIARRGSRVVVAGVLESGCQVPHLPDFVEHELTLLGSTMYVPQDFRDVIALMDRGAISIEGMITHSAPLSEVEEVYRMIDSRSEPFFKIILTTGQQGPELETERSLRGNRRAPNLEFVPHPTSSG